jgi:hypothetical protein
LEAELGVKRAHALPSRIECGYLRSAIRSCFGYLTEVQELSVKTAQKLEKSFCPYCESSKVQDNIRKWKKERFESVQVDDDHLTLFAAQFGRNVELGWNRGKYPYIPNGHACLGVSRREGGTWVQGDFSTACSVASVVSAGKPRIVTLFSEKNNSLLHSLHRSLYSSLSRKGWLLVGDPTNEHVASLNGGEYISVDYRSATDNIKTAYTRAAIEVLINKGEGLTCDEVLALRCVGSLELDGARATRGQPMGSLMSFPLLCLINKTVVDLALNDLLIKDQIHFKEWSGHRCLINGDDLLLRDTSASGALLPVLIANGEAVGLTVNIEKTMVDSEKGEINSTLFVNAVKQKKSNCGALFMSPDEGDVIGYSDRSTLTIDGFLHCVRRGRMLLYSQQKKIFGPLPCKRFRAIVRDPSIRSSITGSSVKITEAANPFPVVPKPVGYDLTREEEIALIDRRVNRLREEGYRPPRGDLPYTVQVSRTSLRRALKRDKPAGDTQLRVLVDGWELKQKEKRMEDPLSEHVPFEHVCDECSGKGLAFRLICEIRELKRVAWLPARGCQVPGTDPSDWAL